MEPDQYEVHGHDVVADRFMWWDIFIIYHQLHLVDSSSQC